MHPLRKLFWSEKFEKRVQCRDIRSTSEVQLMQPTSFPLRPGEFSMLCHERNNKSSRVSCYSRKVLSQTERYGNTAMGLRMFQGCFVECFFRYFLSGKFSLSSAGKHFSFCSVQSSMRNLLTGSTKCFLFNFF